MNYIRTIALIFLTSAKSNLFCPSLRGRITKDGDPRLFRPTVKTAQDLDREYRFKELLQASDLTAIPMVKTSGIDQDDVSNLRKELCILLVRFVEKDKRKVKPEILSIASQFDASLSELCQQVLDFSDFKQMIEYNLSMIEQSITGFFQKETDPKTLVFKEFFTVKYNELEASWSLINRLLLNINQCLAEKTEQSIAQAQEEAHQALTTLNELSELIIPQIKYIQDQIRNDCGKNIWELNTYIANFDGSLYSAINSLTFIDTALELSQEQQVAFAPVSKTGTLAGRRTPPVIMAQQLPA